MRFAASDGLKREKGKAKLQEEEPRPVNNVLMKAVIGDIKGDKKITEEVLRINNGIPEYLVVMKKMMELHPELNASKICCLFLPPDSKEYEDAVKYFKTANIYNAIERERAGLLLSGILGKKYDDGTNVRIVRLIDWTRFKDLGFVTNTDFDRCTEKGIYEKKAGEIVERNDVQGNVDALNGLPAAEMVKVLKFIGLSGKEGFSLTDTYASYEASQMVTRYVRGKILSDEQAKGIMSEYEKRVADKNVPPELDSAVCSVAAAHPKAIKDEQMLLLRKRMGEKYFVPYTNSSAGPVTEDPIYPVAEALADLGARSLPILTEALNSNDKEARKGACFAFNKILGVDPRILADDKLLVLLVKYIGYQRDEISPHLFFGRVGLPEEPLRKMLTDNDVKVRGSACAAASYYSSEYDSPMPKLMDDPEIVKLLLDNFNCSAVPLFQKTGAEYAADAISKVKLDKNRILVVLKEKLKDKDPLVRAASCRAANGLIYSEGADETLSGEILSLISENMGLRLPAGVEGGRSYAAETITELLLSTKTESFVFKQCSEYLRQALTSGDKDIRRAAFVEIVSYMMMAGGEERFNEELIPILVKNLGNNEKARHGSIGFVAELALQKLGMRSVKYLREALNNTDKEIAEKAKKLLDDLQKRR